MITPDDRTAEFGADTLRLYEMFTGPLEQSRPWETKAVVGVFRLLQRIWRTVLDEDTGEIRVADAPADEQTRRVLHKAIAAVRAGMATLRFHVSIARLTELNTHLTKHFPHGVMPREISDHIVLLLAPSAPHAPAALWSRFGPQRPHSLHHFPHPHPSL